MQQWVHTLCVTAMLPTSMGGGHGKVAIIDTEGGFRPEKIGPIAERFGVKGEVSLFTILFVLLSFRPPCQMCLLSFL